MKMITMICISLVLFSGCALKEDVYKNEVLEVLSEIDGDDYNNYINAYNHISDSVYNAIKNYNDVFGLDSTPTIKNEKFNFSIDETKNKEFLKSIEFENSIKDKNSDLYLLYDKLKESSVNICQSYISSFDYYSNEKNKQDGYNKLRYLHNDFIKNYNIFMYNYNEFYMELKKYLNSEKYKELDFLLENNFYVHYSMNRLIVSMDELLDYYLKNDIININLNEIKKIEEEMKKEIKKINSLNEKDLVNYGLSTENINSVDDFKIYIKRLYLVVEEMDNIIFSTQSNNTSNTLDNSVYNYTILKYQNILKSIISSYNNILP